VVWHTVLAWQSVPHKTQLVFPASAQFNGPSLLLCPLAGSHGFLT